MNYFRYKQFNKDVICSRWLPSKICIELRDSISEILRERGKRSSSTTVYRWVQEYAPILYQIWKKSIKSLLQMAY